MPRVPQYQPAISPTRTPSVRQNMSVPQGAFGPDLTGVADQLDTIVKQREEFDAKEAYLAADQELSVLMTDPNNGLLFRQGKNAETLSNDFAAAAGEIRERNAANLSPRARAAYDRFISNAISSGRERVSGHQVSETNKYRNEKDDAITKQNLENAIRDRGLPGSDEFLKAGLATIQSSAARNGWSQEQRDLAESEYRSSVNSGIIDAYIQDDRYDLASEHLSKALETGGITQDAAAKQRQTLDRLKPIAMASEFRARGLSLAETKAAIEKEVKDPILRQSVIGQVITQAEQDKHINDLAYIDRYEAWRDRFDTSRNPAKELELARPWLKAQHQEAAELDMRQRVTGEKIVTDWDLYYKLQTEAASDPEVFGDKTKTDLMKYRGRLGNSEFKQLVDLQAGVIKGPSEDNVAVDISAALSSAGSLIGTQISSDPDLNRKGKVNETKRAEKKQLILSRVSGSIEAATRKKKARLTPEEINAIVTKEIVETTIPGGFWNAYGDKKIHKYDITLDSIGPEEVSKITDAIKSRGISPTESMIVDVYIQSLQRGGM